MKMASNCRIRRRQLPEHALPQRVSVGHRIALVRHADPEQPVRRRVLEGMRDDPVHALVGVDVLLDGDLVLGPRLEPSADVDVDALGVLAEDDEVDVGWTTVLQGAQALVQEPHRAEIDVQVELESYPEEDVARVPHVGDARIAERADENRVEIVAQHRVAVGRQADPGLEVMTGAVGQQLEVEAAAEGLACRAHRLHRFGGDVNADAVSGNHCDAHGSGLAIGNGRIRSPRYRSALAAGGR